MAKIITMDAGFPDQIAARSSEDELEVTNDASGNSIQPEFVKEVITSVTRTEISEALREAQAKFSPKLHQCCTMSAHSQDEE